jgi:hypothetical protein
MPSEDADQPLGLDEYAQVHAAGRTHQRWIDRLPDDVVAEITGSQTPLSVVVAWLESIGYEGATPSKMKPLIDARKRQ